MGLPVVVIVGAPSVGKSTLFNCFTKKKDALVSPYPGTTRDRQLGISKRYFRHFMVIDTGGIYDAPPKDAIEYLMVEQAEHALAEADKILFVLDAQTGISFSDQALSQRLRRLHKPIYIAVNKTENLNVDHCLAEAYELGLGKPLAISAAHGQGIEALVTALFPKSETPSLAEDSVFENLPEQMKLAIVGRPNAGKSTLTNALLGENRVIVHSTAGTTRDSIYIPLKREGKDYILIDTAGVRKRGKRVTLVEKFSVIKTMQAIKDAHVVLYLVDGEVGVSDQDLTLISFVLECGCGLVVAVNKWDQITPSSRLMVQEKLKRELYCVSFTRVHYISAFKKTGMKSLFHSIEEAYCSTTKTLSTAQTTHLLQKALLAHAPPMIRGRRVKLRYAHIGGHYPLRVVVHGTAVHLLPETYKRYLANFFQNALNLMGITVKLIFKSSQNPFAS